MLTDQECRAVLCEAFRRQFGREGNRSEMQCLQAVAWLETSYAAGWKPPGAGSWNFGACQAGANWRGATFVYTDTHPTADGRSVPYVVKFRAYPSAVDGAADLVKIVYVNKGRSSALAAAGAGDIAGFSAELHATGYYEGFGATVGARIAHHYEAVVKAIRRQCRNIGEPLPASIPVRPEPPPTLRYGARGADVRRMQELLAARGAPLTIDGGFGPGTLAAVRTAQTRAGLTADGVCGPATWAALGAR